MRIATSVAVFAVFLFLPSLIARADRLLTVRQQIVLSTATLVGLAVSFFGFLGAIITPTGLGIPQTLGAVEFCLMAGAKLFQHPLKHWPSIAAAFLLLVFLIRLAVGLLLTVRDARRAHPAKASSAFASTNSSGIRVLATTEPVAYAAGVIHPRVVVSAGLLESLDAAEIRAVVAHERAHVRGLHLPLLFLAKVIQRAFGGIPSVRRATGQLASALEASADDAAVAAVGDRLVVLQALHSVAEARRDQLVPGMGGGNLGVRARRIAAPPALIVGGWFGRALVVGVIAITIGATSIAWSAGRDALTHELIALDLHQACHLPHASGQP